MNQVSTMPLYVRFSIGLVGVYFLVLALQHTQSVLQPLVFAGLIVILINPIVNILIRHKLNRVVAILLVLTIFLVVLVSLGALVNSQVSMIKSDLPLIGDRVQGLLSTIELRLSEYFMVSQEEISVWMATGKEAAKNLGSATVGTTLSVAGGVLTTLLIMPVYVFLILINKNHLMKFIWQIFGDDNKSVAEIIVATKTIIQKYLIGLLTELFLVSILNIAGLFILGINHALLLGTLGALLNVIPYLGGIIAMAMFAFMALLTKPPVYILYVVLVYGVIQFIDNNIIVPRVVGGKVKLNALISLFAVIVGAEIWGISGMILAIPFMAIIKLIFDRIDYFKPWGFLLGNDINFIDSAKLRAMFNKGQVNYSKINSK